MNPRLLADYMPIRVHWEQGYPLVDWCHFGEARFEESFFDQTIEKRLRHPFALLFRPQTPLDDLVELHAIDPGVPPTGFIFHMSRCGSTLLSQMLAALPSNIVISEASPIDGILHANWRNPNITDEQRIRWLRGLLSAYARPRQGEQHFFVKFDSWHTLELSLIQRAFPGVPWIFLYREPVQVLVSHQRQRGPQVVQGMLPPQWLGLDPATLGSMTLDEYTACVLAKICQGALHYRNADARWVNYQQLPAVLWEELAAHFRLAYSPAEIAAIQQVLPFNAKNPGLYFVGDTKDKEHQATPELRQLAEQWLRPVYTALEEQRHAEGPPISP